MSHEAISQNTLDYTVVNFFMRLNGGNRESSYHTLITEKSYEY